MSVLDEIVVPYGWELERFDSCFDRIRCVGHPDAAPLSVFLGLGVVLRSSRDDNHNQLGSDLSKYQLVEPFDIVFNRLRAWQGGFGVSKYRGIVSPAYIVARPRVGVDSRFVCFLLLSSVYLSELTRVSKFMPPSQFDILWGDLKCVKILVPPLATQKAIANFLDKKTAAIDALIDKKRRLLDLLAEKRAALLEHLLGNLNAPCVKLSKVAELLPGYAFSSGDFMSNGDGVLLLRGINLKVGEIVWEDVVRWPSDMLTGVSRFMLKPGDVVLGMDRPWVSSGLRVAKISDSDCPSLLLQRVARIRVGRALCSDYLMLALEWKKFRAYLEPEMTGVSVPHLSGEQILSYAVPLPSLKEQESIAQLINAQFSMDARVVICLNQQIERLQEYRQSLITAAVTGQLNIDAEEGA